MINQPKISLYINVAKPYYYPGEKFAATILIDVREKVNCNKITIISKGKQIIKASQVNKFTNEDKKQVVESSSSSSSDSDDGNKYRQNLQEEGPIVKIQEEKEIFKISKEVVISQSKVLIIGKHSIPFEIELPQDIPGTFLYLEKNIYAEVAYSVKVKLNGLNIKRVVPIVIRQKKEVFGYLTTNQFGRKIHGCCCVVGQTNIKITANEEFTHTGDPIKLTVNIDNETNTTTTPFIVEIYRKLLLKSGNKKIRVTKIVGAYQGKRIINAREKFNKKLHVAIQNNDYLKEHIEDTKAAKSFKHKEIIPFLFQSIKSDQITCEFEVYAETQYANITNDDLGVFLSVLIYPIEDGAVSKTVANLAKQFVNGILNKKIFLKAENLFKKEANEQNKKKDKKPKTKKKIYEESIVSQEELRFENKLSKNLMNQKGNIESDDEDENYNNINNDNNKIQNEQIKYDNSKINNEDKNSIDDNDMDFNANNQIKNNKSGINNDYNNNYNNNKVKDSKNLNSEEISFGNSSKEKQYFTNDKSSYIKKDFNKAFLNDPLDQQMSDDEN